MLCEFCFKDHDEYCVALDNCRLIRWLDLVQWDVHYDLIGHFYFRSFTFTGRPGFELPGLSESEFTQSMCYIKARQFAGNLGVPFRDGVVEFCRSRTGYVPTISGSSHFRGFWAVFTPPAGNQNEIRKDELWNQSSRVSW